MAKKKKRVTGRRLIQLFWAAVSNSYVTGFAAGKIYRGSLKNVCAPGLNCYSCPGARLACPIGSLQAVLGSRAFQVSTYVFGAILLMGAVMGRMVCGFLCPFGLIQELLYKIPFVKKVRTFRGDKQLRYVKYLLLAVLVVLLPMVMSAGGDAPPMFCKYVCPAGALEGGVPLVAADRLKGGLSPQEDAKLPALEGFQGLPGLQNIGSVVSSAPKGNTFKIGFLYWWKISILLAVALSSVVMYRPFCRYLCPLGAMYGLLNPVALYRLRLDTGKCISCGRCKRACGMCLDPVKTTNHPECVRCGDCVRACPTGALSAGFGEARIKIPVPDMTVKAAAGGKEQ